MKVGLTIEFQTEILKYLCQTKNSKPWVEMLDTQCFDLPEQQVVYDLLKDYIKEYTTTPDKARLLEYFQIVGKKQKIKGEVIDQIGKVIRDCYKTLGGDDQLIKESLIKYAQRKKTKNLIQENADKIKDADPEFFEYLMKEMNGIVRIADNIDGEDSQDGGLLFADYNKKVYADKKVYPTYLHHLNSMTTVGGFRTPELIIILAGPKSFKTGLLINLAVDYAQSGVPVYYVDTENGVENIRDRMNMCMLQCDWKTYKSGKYNKELKQIVKRSEIMGGDIAIDYYPANQKSCADIRARLAELKAEKGFVPKVIFIDYPDLLIPEDKSIKDNRLKIQNVYHDIVRMNVALDCFSVGVSQVNRKAVEKEIITMQDFAEDFGKAMNCHAAFALCRTPEEKELGFGRLVPVVQRMGVSFKGVHQAHIVIREETMTVMAESYAEMLDTIRKNPVKRNFDDERLNDD